MNSIKHSKMILVIALLLQSTTLNPGEIRAQGTLADYERAEGLRARLQPLAINVPERATWIGSTSRFWYRKSVKDGNQFTVVNAETLEKQPAFDHQRLAESLSRASGQTYTALKLPFNTITFVDGDKAIEFVVGPQTGFRPGQGGPGGGPPDGPRWRCDLSDYSCKKVSSDSPRNPRGQFDGPPRGIPGPQYDRPTSDPKTSPDGKWEALINNYNVHIRLKGKRE